MQRRGTTLLALAAIGVAAASYACSSDGSGSGSLSTGSDEPSAAAPIQVGVGTNTETPGGGSTPGTSATSNGADPNLQQNPNIAARAYNYGEALRTASMKLVGALPSLVDIDAIANAASTADQKTIYAAKIDAMLADPRFASTQIEWWRNTFKTGGAGDPMNGVPSFDTAATFAAMVVVNDRPYTDLFTASSGTCPTYAKGAFVAADCANNAPTAGILTDPGLMSQFFSDMAFRRVRFVQETFACSQFPAEYGPTPVPMGASIYTSPWDFNSISGGPGANINFHDTSSIVCANCHTTINHIAPLFAFFDASGQYTPNKIQVMTPITPPVTSVRSDWLPPSQGYAWRNGTPVTDLPSLGQAMAKDPEVATCAVNRIWDWAFSRGDIVNDVATIPPVVTQAIAADFSANNFDFKREIKAVFTSDDFVQF